MKTLSVLLIALMMTACGTRTETVVLKGEKGDKGDQGYGAGVLAESIAGLCGATDGVRVTAFQDKNNNGLLDLDESVNSVTSVCNGANGRDGMDGQDGHDGLDGRDGVNGTSSTITVSSSAPSCGSKGGYTLTTTTGAVSTSFPICNGAQGAQGQQGIQGLAGSNGTIVTPVKFCSNDNSAFVEYGLYVGGDLYAVYWGDTPGSNGHKEQAFLTKLAPGSYQSTGGNNCTFTVNSNLSIQ